MRGNWQYRDEVVETRRLDRCMFELMSEEVNWEAWREVQVLPPNQVANRTVLNANGRRLRSFVEKRTSMSFEHSLAGDLEFERAGVGGLGAS